jgi:hypothetical protein
MSDGAAWAKLPQQERSDLHAKDQSMRQLDGKG